MIKLLLITCIFFSVKNVYAAKCADFKTQQEAQRFYEKKKKEGGTGWKNLDRDNDGRACDCLPGGNGTNCPNGKR